MVDAVQSGGYGVLGLYGAQAPVVAESPAPQPAVTATSQPTGQGVALAAPVIEAAQAVGSGPVPPADGGSAGGETAGRDYAGEGQAQARQTAVAASLAGAAAVAGQGEAGATTATGSRSNGNGQAARSYARTGAASLPRAGAMFSARV